MEKLFGKMQTFFSTMSVDAYGTFIMVLLSLFLYGLWKANKSSESKFIWEDLVMGIDMASGQYKASTTKILQLIGGVTATFVIVKVTLQDKLTWDIFGLYLAYVASVDGFSKFLLAKYGVTSTTPPTK